MAIRTGLLTGIKRGILAGIDTNFFTGTDQSSIAVPTDAAGFSALGATTPTYFWPCQEASGNLSSTIGSLTLTNNGAGVHLFQQSIPGWTRLAVGAQTNETVCAWRTNTGPLAGTQSVAWFGLFQFPAVAGSARPQLAASQGGGAGTQLTAGLTTAGIMRMDNAGTDVDGTYNYVDGAVHPVIVALNRTAQTVNVFTDKEKLTGTYNAAVANGTQKGVGSCVGGATSVYRLLWLGAYAGATAELDWKAELQRYGWNISW